MNWLLQYAWVLAAATKRYHFAGDDPIQGFDCSGYVMELLIASGVFPHNTDMNAQGLYNYFEKNGSMNVWAPGSLAFYGKDSLNIGHIGFCISDKLMLEAGGGDSTTVTDQQAIKQNAFIKMRPIKYRRDFFCVIKPSYASLGLI